MKKLTIIGAGNLGQAIASGVVQKGVFQKTEVVLTRKRKDTPHLLEKAGFTLLHNNAEAVMGADVIVLAVQPKQVDAVLKEIAPSLLDGQVLISVATGVPIQQIRTSVIGEIPIIRAMPNTAVAIGESMTCIASEEPSGEVLGMVVDIFKALGDVLVIEERLMKAATVLGASGIAFFMRYLRAATQGGIEMGFHPEEAQRIAVQTAKGAAGLIVENGNHPEVEIDQVTTPQGCTIAGLNEMEHQGLSSALIKGLLTSFEKINTIQS